MIRPRAMIPTMMFSIVVVSLDLLAAPDEGDHQGEKADGC
jgi:hypothetical protein